MGISSKRARTNQLTPLPPPAVGMNLGDGTGEIGLAGEQDEPIFVFGSRTPPPSRRATSLGGLTNWVASMGCPRGGITRRMLVTGYDNSFRSTGKNPGDPGYGITAYQTVAGPGTIAAPPNIERGTQMYVPGYGLGTVHDRGSAIQGDHIDLWFASEREALNWGNPILNVHVCR